ncbi:MAG: nucleotidyltransferase domain-containing protein [Candidatus Xenobia bacterium]
MALEPLVMQVATEFKHRLLKQLGDHVLELRVFGSRVRGNARADSDIDLFVMLDDDDWKLKDVASRVAWEVEYEKALSFPIHTLVMSRQHFEELQRRERMIAREITEQGVAI